MREHGVSGTPIFHGYITDTETNAKLRGGQRYRTAANILTNVSIVAAGIRYFLNLVAKPAWQVESVDDTPKAIEAKEFVEDVIDQIETSWARIIRRSGMYRYHGFGIAEWTAVKRDDGKIGIKDIEQRPQYTIERWGTDDTGAVTGVWQRDPMDGGEIWLPRSKIVYLVDDMMTDNPEGMGWFRALAEPAERITRLLELETIGFERNLGGTPVGRAPLAQLRKLEKEGGLPPGTADNAIAVMNRIVQTQRKSVNTGFVLDSETYLATTADGSNPSAVMKWGIELLTGEMKGVAELGNAIDRGFEEMARIIGVESLLIGKDGGGSLALSRDKSANLYLVANSTLGDMAEAFDRDLVDTLWALNGFDPELRPKLKTEDVAFKDVEQIAAVLRDMATAGATLAPDDPAINDLRDLAGISRVPDDIMERGVELETRPPLAPVGPDGLPIQRGGPGPGGPGNPPPKGKPPGGKGAAPSPGKSPGGESPVKKPAKKYSPSQSRDPGGEGGGQWVSDGGDGEGSESEIDVPASAEYEAATAAANAAYAEFEPIRDGYRQGKVADAEFLVARAKYEESKRTFDAAFNAEVARAGQERTRIAREPKPSGNEGQSELFGKFNPDQPRDPKGTSTGGQFASTGASGKHEVHGWKKAEALAGQIGKALEELHAMASENQDILAKAGSKIGAEESTQFVDPGVKKLARMQEKFEQEFYDDYGKIADMARGTFVVDSMEHSDRMVERLSEVATVYDKGWVKLNPSEYVDRKVIMKFPNGGVAEMQLVPQKMFDAKGEGGGHEMYDFTRAPAGKLPEAIAIGLAAQTKMYHRAAAGTEFAHIQSN